MKKFWRILLMIGLLILSFDLRILAAGEDGTAILQRADNELFPSQARFTFRMDEYENNGFKRYYLCDSYYKGQDRYLLIGLEPAVFKGVVELRIEDTIFYYLKKIDKTTQVSAKVAFYDSNLSQEDVMNTKLSNFYNLESYQKDHEGGKDLYVLNMLAKSKEVAYYRIVSYIDAASFQPVKREYYAFSGQKVREMTFDDIRFQDGRLVALKFTMFNSLRKGYYTKVSFDDFNYDQEIPDIYFTKTYMRTAAR